MPIYSIWGPPHSGKTSLAIDLAHALSKNDYSVCLISPELYSELSARMRINITEDKSIFAACKTTESLKHVVYKVTELLYVLAAPCYNDAFSEDISSEAARKVLRQANTLFDFVLVDCPSHANSAVAAWAMNLSDKVLLLSGCQTDSLLWHKAFHRAIETLADRTIPVCTEISNNFTYSSLHKLIEFEPEIWLRHIKDAEALQNKKHTLYRVGGKGGKKYSAAIEKLCTLLEGGET